MTDYDSIISDIKIELADIQEGRLSGWTCGFEGIDELAGRLEPGSMTTIGGYSGTGKSYFANNMIDGMLREWRNNSVKGLKPPKIALFSTELSQKQYVLRHILMRVGIYKNQYQREPKRYKKLVDDAIMEYYEERKLNPESLNIYGNIYNFEQIEEILKASKANVIIVDYVQALGIKGRYEAKDAMPLLAISFSGLAQKYQSAVVLVSQINNYIVAGGSDPNSNQLAPFNFGKQMNEASTTSLYLVREKEEGVMKKELNVIIMKARNGELGRKIYQIAPGYKLLPIRYAD